MTRQETPATATSRPQGAEQPADGTQGASTYDRPSGGHTVDPTETLARALAAAAHINPQRSVPPWGDLTPQQRNGYRAEAERATGKEGDR